MSEFVIGGIIVAAAGLAWAIMLWLMLRHQHQYEETERVYAPGGTPFEGHGIEPETVKALAFGQTTIISRCHCGKMQKTVIYGDATKRASVTRAMLAELEDMDNA